MMRPSRLLLAACAASFLVYNITLPTASEGQDPLQLAEQRRAQRQATAQPMHFVVPHFSIAGEDSATLYLVNATAFPQSLDLAAVSPAGEILPLGNYLAEPQRHLALDLAALIPENQAEFHHGSLSVRMLGDPQALAGWVVLHRGTQTLEVPLSVASAAPGELLSFWSPVPGADGSLSLAGA